MELTPLSRVLLCLRGAFLCLRLQRVILGSPTLALSFALWFGGAFLLLQIHRSKVSLFLFKLFLILDSISVHHAKRGDVQGFHLVLEVPL